MKLCYHLFVIAVLLCVVYAGPLEEGKRLIQFSDTRKEWLTQAEVDQLMFQPGIHNFMDVTDFDEMYSAMKDVKDDATPIPTAPVHQQYVKTLLPLADTFRIENTITALSDFYTRYYTSETGTISSQWLQHQYLTLSAGRRDIEVTNFTYTRYPQISVIATIPGTGPNKDSVVIIGGHLDSVGTSGTALSPGADDDASGSASVLEIFRVLVAAGYKPDYTLKFMGYAAEEAGLLGSQGIAADFVKNEIDVYAVLQLDMTGYKGNSIGIITDYTSSELNTFVRILVSTYTSLSWSNSVCGYGCSDHASWNRTGYRASFPFETPFGAHNPDIHSSRDVLANLDSEQLLQFVYLGIGFAVELAGVASSQ